MALEKVSNNTLNGFTIQSKNGSIILKEADLSLYEQVEKLIKNPQSPEAKLALSKIIVLESDLQNLQQTSDKARKTIEKLVLAVEKADIAVTRADELVTKAEAATKKAETIFKDRIRNGAIGFGIGGGASIYFCPSIEVAILITAVGTVAGIYSATLGQKSDDSQEKKINAKEKEVVA